MNKNQKIVLITASIITVIIILFPPFKLGSGGSFYGYRFIAESGYIVIDWARMTLSLIGVVFLSIVGILLTKDK